MAREELELIDWFRSQPQPQGDVVIGPGDDMAALTAGGQALLVASDMVLEGTHFDPGACTWDQVGRKALAACLSDCAAMAVAPRCATVALALPRGRVLATGRAILEGMLALAHEWACPIVGGDTTSWDGRVAIDVTVCAAPWPGITPVQRAGGRADDLLCVSGPLGGSLAGHHLTFTPRITEARDLATALGRHLHAMLDITDGLALDTHRLATASGQGAVLDRSALLDVARPELGADGLDRVLGDGEDFELLAAVDPAAAPLLATLDCPWRTIGRLCADGLWLADDSGARTPLAPVGFAH